MNCTNCTRRIRTKADRLAYKELTLCFICYEEAGLENEHQDGLHDDDLFEGCPECDRIAGLAADDRSHFDTAPHSYSSHAFCYENDLHPATKAGRAACRRDPLLPENRI